MGTLVAESKEAREFDDEMYIMERAIKGDFGIVKAQKADTFGNLVFEKTARNFNPLCAMAAKITVVEVEELVELGDIDPDEVHMSGVYVDYIYLGEKFEKRIEKRTVKEDVHG